jgi:hypothetical protein
MRDPLTPMTNEDYSKVPPPHLLKKFSEQARVDSQKRGHPGYCKTFAKLCIDWAFQETAMDDLRIASAEASGVELNFKSTPNNLQIRSSDITPPPELVLQWIGEYFGCTAGGELSDSERFLTARAAQWGADQELEACLEWLEQNQGRWEIPMALSDARRPKPQSLNGIALDMVGTIERDAHYLPEITDTIRRALEALPD